MKASRSPAPTLNAPPTPPTSGKKRKQPPATKGNWHADEDALISAMKLQSPLPKESEITAAVNALKNSPGSRTVRGVCQRWNSTLKFDVVAGGALSVDEEVQLLKAVKEVESDKWAGVAAVFNSRVAGRKLGKGAARKLFDGLKAAGKV